MGIYSVTKPKILYGGLYKIYFWPPKFAVNCHIMTCYFMQLVNQLISCSYTLYSNHLVCIELHPHFQ